MTIKGDSLGDRMKDYEDSFRHFLPKRMPVILRVDGKAFHTLTRKMHKPYDTMLTGVMNNVALTLLDEVQNAVAVYVQSDEISVLLNNYKKLNSESWFGNNLQKMASVSASIATGAFNKFAADDGLVLPVQFATFDSRAFVLPEAEVTNYFIWRQQDWMRNSIQMLARSLFSQKQLNGKNTDELKRMCLAERRDWDFEHSWIKFGRFASVSGRDIVTKNAIWEPTPVFKLSRNVIDDLLIPTFEP